MLGVVIPARNEEKNIGSVISALLSMGTLRKDIFLIDSLSTDKTASIAKSLNINVVSAKKIGYQAALSDGLEALVENGYSEFLIVDGDDEISHNAIKFFLNINQYHSKLNVGVRPRAKRFGEALVNYFFYYRYGVKDILCGIKRGSLELFNPNNSLEYGLDLFYNTFFLDQVSNIPIEVTLRDESRLGGTFAVNIDLIKNLAKFIIRK